MPRKKRELQKLPTYQKRSDARIFILAYKPVPYKLPSNPLYTTIHCGAALHKYHFGVPDNMGLGDDISKYNNVYCDLTGTYWLWKHRPDSLKWIGTCQYSKLLRFHLNTDFDTLFQDYNACAVSLYATINTVPTTVRLQWQHWHPKELLDVTEDVIKTYYPEWFEAWDKYVNNGNRIYYSNGMVLKAEDFDKYCELYFGICDKIIEHYGATKDTIFDVFKAKFDSGEWVNHFIGRSDNYHCLLFGFLAERVVTMYLRNLGEIMELEYEHKPHI